jgi:hypothetical protein
MRHLFTTTGATVLTGLGGCKGQGTVSADEHRSIVVFLRHLPPAGSQGTPDMYTH